MASKKKIEPKARKPRPKKVKAMLEVIKELPQEVVLQSPERKLIVMRDDVAQIVQGHSRIVYAERLPGRLATYYSYLAVIYELPPQIVRLHYGHKGFNDCVSYDVSFPYTLWTYVVLDPDNTIVKRSFSKEHLRLQSPVVYISGSKIPFAEKGLDTDLFCLPLHNQHNLGNSYVCLGDTINHRIDTAKPLSEIGSEIDRSINNFMASKWTDSIGNDYSGSSVTSYDDWQAKTARDPEYYKQMQLRPKTCGNVNGMLTGVICQYFSTNRSNAAA